MDDLNYWSRTVYAEPPLRDLDKIEDALIFSWLSDTFPVLGSKIDWAGAAGRHSHRRLTDDSELGLARAEVCTRISRSGPAIHVGDGLSPTGVYIPPECSEAVVAALLSIPEHHYFVDVNHTWIVVVSLEGDVDTLDFGR